MQERSLHGSGHGVHRKGLVDPSQGAQLVCRGCATLTKKKSLSGQSSIERESGKAAGSLEDFEVRFKPWATCSEVIADAAPPDGSCSRVLSVPL